MARSLANHPGVRALWLTWLRLRNELPERRPTELEPGVFVGGIPTRARWCALQAVGITRVICLLGEAEPDAWITTPECVLWLPVRDREAPSPDQFHKGCVFLDEAKRDGHGAFIYCGAGMGRAPTMYAAWWLWRNTADVDTVLDTMRQARRVVSPTAHQIAALERWATAAG